MAPLLNRLRKEWRELCKHNKASLSMYNLLKHLPLPEGPEIEAGLRNNFAETDIILFPHNDETLTEWVAFVNGPPDTPFQGARFQLKIQVLTKKRNIALFFESLPITKPSFLILFPVYSVFFSSKSADSFSIPSCSSQRQLCNAHLSSQCALQKWGNLS